MRSTPVWSKNTTSKVVARMSNGRKVATGRVASAAVAIVRPPHAVNPARTIHIRVVPRSRMVWRSALYSSRSRGVIDGPFSSERVAPIWPIWAVAAVAGFGSHCGTGVGL